MLALAGWVRSTLTPDKGRRCARDLDRLVLQAIIPERVKRLHDEPDAGDRAVHRRVGRVEGALEE